MNNVQTTSVLNGRRIEAAAPGKLNLFLEVLGRRADGFHDLETVMVRCSLADQMRFTARQDERLNLTLVEGSVGADRFPLDESNLILKAAQALKQAAGLSAGADIQVLKRIPSEAGLAGGSSNAATTLKALNTLWQAGRSVDQLHELAAELGSDINFFVAGCPAALCTGRGEKVEPLPWSRRLYAVVARPRPGNSTPEIFRRVTMSEARRSVADLLSELATGSAADLSQEAFNRLTEAARQVNPQMSCLMDQMYQCCGVPVQMSGSGSTCFVLSSSRRRAQIWLKQIQAATAAVFTSLVRL